MKQESHEILGRTKCRVEIEVLHEVAQNYAHAVDIAKDENAIAEAAGLMMAANDILYKKLITECGCSFEQAEALVQKLNLEAFKKAQTVIQSQQ